MHTYTYTCKEYIYQAAFRDVEACWQASGGNTCTITSITIIVMITIITIIISIYITITITITTFCKGGFSGIRV